MLKGFSSTRHIIEFHSTANRLNIFRQCSCAAYNCQFFIIITIFICPNKKDFYFFHNKNVGLSSYQMIRLPISIYLLVAAAALFRNKGFLVNLKTETNASKFAKFMEKENPRSFFHFSFRATFIFPL